MHVLSIYMLSKPCVVYENLQVIYQQVLWFKLIIDFFLPVTFNNVV